MELKLKNKTSQPHEVEFYGKKGRESSIVKSGGEITIKKNSIHKNELERVKKFFNVIEIKEKSSSIVPSAEPKEEKKGAFK